MAVNLRQTPRDFQNTLDVYSELVTNRRGGGFTVVPTAVVEDFPAQGAARPTQFINDTSDLKPFIISIYNQKEDIDKISLALMINPSDISIGQTYVSSDSYTREGWITSLWGRNQSTINANCSTSGFYVHGVGLSTFFRKFSVAFKNFAGFLGIFKNGGYYYAQGQNNQDIFRNDPGRVITVMDQIKISYDDVEYLGSFSSLAVDENVEMPYRIQFNFEFIVSGMRGESAEGHLMRCDDLGCNNISGPKVSTQGAYNFEEIISLDSRALSNAFPQFMPPIDSKTSKSRQPLGLYPYSTDGDPGFTDTTILNPDGIDSSTPWELRLPSPVMGSDSVGFRRQKDITNFNKLEPIVYKKFLEMAQEYSKRTGKILRVNDSYRSYQGQVELKAYWTAKGKPQNAATPGTSMHGTGYALDLQSKDVEALKELGLLEAYGFKQNLMTARVYEQWHIEYFGPERPANPPQK